MDGMLVSISLIDFLLTIVADGGPRIFGTVISHKTMMLSLMIGIFSLEFAILEALCLLLLRRSNHPKPLPLGMGL